MAEQSTTASVYDPTAVEAKWRERWAERRTNAVDVHGAERPYFNLMMFPYPSAEGLHVGNVFAFVGSDIHGRTRRLQGWDVFEPLGFDAFGIHSENYALKVDTHPGKLIPQNIARWRSQYPSITCSLASTVLHSGHQLTAARFLTARPALKSCTKIHWVQR